MNYSYKTCSGIQNNDQKIVSNLYELLKNDEDRDDKDLLYCSNQRTIGTQENNLDKCLKLNVEYKKRESEVRERRNIETTFSNGFQSDHSSNNVSNKFIIIQSIEKIQLLFQKSIRKDCSNYTKIFLY